jgi:type I restriction enzyme S subunit
MGTGFWTEFWRSKNGQGKLADLDALVQVQIQSMATGLAQPHITQEWLAQIRVPLIPRNEEVAEGVKKHHECLMRANSLTTQAIVSVESLIDGTLDEDACLEEGRHLADEFGLERP